MPVAAFRVPTDAREFGLLFRVHNLTDSFLQSSREGQLWRFLAFSENATDKPRALVIAERDGRTLKHAMDEQLHPSMGVPGLSSANIAAWRVIDICKIAAVNSGKYCHGRFGHRRPRQHGQCKDQSSHLKFLIGIPSRPNSMGGGSALSSGGAA